MGYKAFRSFDPTKTYMCSHCGRTVPAVADCPCLKENALSRSSSFGEKERVDLISDPQYLGNALDGWVEEKFNQLTSTKSAGR